MERELTQAEIMAEMQQDAMEGPRTVQFKLGDIVRITENEPDLGGLEGDIVGSITNASGTRYKVHVNERWEETYEVPEANLEIVQHQWEITQKWGLYLIGRMTEQLSVIQLRIESGMETTRYADLSEELGGAAAFITEVFINTSPPDLAEDLRATEWEFGVESRMAEEAEKRG